MQRFLRRFILLRAAALFAGPALLAGPALFAGPAALADPAELTLYDIDTEGGAAVLFIAPSGETALIDTGFPGARDASRIAEAANAAGVTRIDYLIITHYHGDHIGGFPELAKRLPIGHFVDHGPTVQPEQHLESKAAYDAATVTGPHLIAKAGDKLPIRGLDWSIVAAAGKTLVAPLKGAPGAGKANPYCAKFSPKDITLDLENRESIGSVVAYGKFRVVELGDLLWNLEGELACPVNKIGTVDLLLTTHHGSDWSGVPALIYALRPTAAIMNNGILKGGSVEAFETLESSPGLQNLWQLHWSANAMLEHNVAGRFIANVEDPAATAIILQNPPAPTPNGVRPPVLGNPQHSPAYWIKVSARADGSFTVTNSRNGFSKIYDR